jgi:hypothetical protein
LIRLLQHIAGIASKKINDSGNDQSPDPSKSNMTSGDTTAVLDITAFAAASPLHNVKI